MRELKKEKKQLKGMASLKKENVNEAEKCVCKPISKKIKWL